MSVFDRIERTDLEPASHLIGKFDYLNESARPEAAQVRDIVDFFFDNYPGSHSDEMRNRLRSRDNQLHRSTFFELALHELLIRRGFEVLEIEPTLANGKSPDFLVAAPDGTRFYLEATLAGDGASRGAEQRMRDALQAIDDVQSPDFFLSVHSHGYPSQSIPVGQLRRDLQAHVDGLNYEALREAFEHNEALPVFRREWHGAQFSIEVVPKGTRGQRGRAMGVRMLAPLQVQPQEPIKSAILRKATRYGDLDLPYVVAVNAIEDYAGEDSAIDALFGSPAVEHAMDRPPRPIRLRDGVWYGPRGARNTRVSAVLSTERLSPWDLARRSARLFHNPWARRPLPQLPLGVEIRQLIEGRWQVEAGSSFQELFGLPEDWPE